LQTIQEIEQGRTKSLPQDASLASKAPKLTKEHGLIDWTRPAQTVCNQIRAMQPWPTAYTFWRREGKPPLRMMILKAKPAAKQELGNAVPGQVVLASDSPQILHVMAGDGRLVDILEVQPAGKKRMPIADFLRGHPAQPGDFLGDENGQK
jgi:methionyl-tRNA formyltransferase